MNEPANQDNLQELSIRATKLTEIAEYLREQASDAATAPLVDNILVDVLANLARVQTEQKEYESAIITLEESDMRAANAIRYFHEHVHEYLNELDRLLTLKDDFRYKIRSLKELIDKATVQDRKPLLHPVSPEKITQALDAGTRKLEDIQQQLPTQSANDEIKERPEQSD